VNLTIGELREALKDVPDNTLVYYQRIEDWYFEKNGWVTIPLYFEDERNISNYIMATSAYKHPDGGFVINAHY